MPNTDVQVQVFLTATGFVYVGCGDLALHVACGSQVVDAYAHVMLDQARIAAGEAPLDPALYSKRIAELLAKGL